MNKRFNSLLGASALGVSLLLAAAAWSMGPGGGEDYDPAHKVAHLADRLGLDEDQQNSIEALMTAGREQGSVDRERLHELKDLLRAQVQDFDPGETQQIADELGEITARLSYQRTSTWAQVHAILTPEQRAQLEAMHEQRGERRSKWRQRGDGS